MWAHPLLSFPIFVFRSPITCLSWLPCRCCTCKTISCNTRALTVFAVWVFLRIDFCDSCGRWFGFKWAILKDGPGILRNIFSEARLKDLIALRDYSRTVARRHNRNSCVLMVFAVLTHPQISYTAIWHGCQHWFWLETLEMKVQSHQNMLKAHWRIKGHCRTSTVAVARRRIS